MSGLQLFRGLWRTMKSEPAFVAAFVLTLGLGIGANTAIFSLVSGVLLEPLPYPDPDRLMIMKQPATLQGIDDVRFSFLEVEDYRSQSSTVAEFVEFGDWTFNVLDRGEPHRAVAGLVTANFFEVLGMRPFKGRLFLEGEEDRGAAPVVVLTHEYWTRALGADPSVVGQVLNLTSVQPEIVGILEPGLHYASDGRNQDFYANYANSDHYVSATMQDDRNHRMTRVFAKLEPGVTPEQASADLERIAATLHQEHAEDYPEGRGLATTLSPWREELVKEARPILWATLLGSALVLLIACANVANLTLVRAMRRSRELSVRAALGGTNAQLRLGFFLESFALALCGAALGVAIAFLMLDLLRAYAANLTLRTAEIALDYRVLALTLITAMVCATALAFLPGTSPGRKLAQALSAGGARSIGSAGRSRVQRLLVISQLAVSFLLLFASVQLGRTLLNLYGIDPGYELDKVLTVEAPKFSQVPPSELNRFTDQTVEQVTAIHGVESVAMTQAAPLGGSTAFPLMISVRGGEVADESKAQPTLFDTVTPGYFKTLGIELVRGREFHEADREDTEKVVILNETAARHYFQDKDPVGEQIAYDFGGFFGGQSEWLTIIGVSKATRSTSLQETNDHGLFLCECQFAQAMPGMAPDTVLVRTATADPHEVAPQVLENLRALDPERPLEHVRTLAEARDETIAPQRLNALLFGSFALLALLIATVGVGAMLMWSVITRRRELAIRAAVGADPGKLLRSVLTEGGTLVAIGLALGTGIALVAGRFLNQLLYEVAPHGCAHPASCSARVGSRRPTRRAAARKASHEGRSDGDPSRRVAPMSVNARDPLSSAGAIQAAARKRRLPGLHPGPGEKGVGESRRHPPQGSVAVTPPGPADAPFGWHPPRFRAYEPDSCFGRSRLVSLRCRVTYR